MKPLPMIKFYASRRLMVLARMAALREGLTPGQFARNALQEAVFRMELTPKDRTQFIKKLHAHKRKMKTLL